MMLADNKAKNSRERVLQNLLVRERCTINELAEAVDINPISVRHHIVKLEAEGMVDSEEVRHGVGRPRRLYFLTEKGREQFPTRYIRLTLRLLDQLKETATSSFIEKLFTQMAEDMASDYQTQISGLSFDKRLELVRQLLSREGFNVEVEKQADLYLIHENSCPYYHIGQDHPEVCSVDQTLISTLLDIPAQKIQCLLQGDSVCTYVISNVLVEDTEIVTLVNN
jgi:DeoR family suf operon transcriptional repressor